MRTSFIETCESICFLDIDLKIFKFVTANIEKLIKRLIKGTSVNQDINFFVFDTVVTRRITTD